MSATSTLSRSVVVWHVESHWYYSTTFNEIRCHRCNVQRCSLRVHFVAPFRSLPVARFARLLAISGHLWPLWRPLSVAGPPQRPSKQPRAGQPRAPSRRWPQDASHTEASKHQIWQILTRHYIQIHTVHDQNDPIQRTSNPFKEITWKKLL